MWSMSAVTWREHGTLIPETHTISRLLVVSDISCRADNVSCILRRGNSRIGNLRKNLPFAPTRFATLKLDTVPVTEDGEQRATIPVSFPNRRIEERC